MRELYSFAVQPDLAVYFRVPIDVSLDRLLARRVKLKFYEAGMDMGWSTNAGRELPAVPGQGARGVRRIVDEYGLRVIDASGSITEQQRVVRKLVSRNLEIEADRMTSLDEPA